MSNTAQYVLFAIVLFVLGRITQLFSFEEEEELEDLEVSLDESPDQDLVKDLEA
jgi:hypothetical protein